MGCDIHLHKEVKINGKWHYYGQARISRNYQLFGLIAGVRDADVQSISRPRGLPNDATEMTMFEYNNDLGHTPTYIKSSEVDKIDAFYFAQSLELNDPFGLNNMEREFGYLFGNSWTGFFKYPCDRPDGLEDFRFICWFDS